MTIETFEILFAETLAQIAAAYSKDTLEPAWRYFQGLNRAAVNGLENGPDCFEPDLDRVKTALVERHNAIARTGAREAHWVEILSEDLSRAKWRHVDAQRLLRGEAAVSAAAAEIERLEALRVEVGIGALVLNCSCPACAAGGGGGAN